jgi:spore coat protein H
MRRIRLLGPTGLLLGRAALAAATIGCGDAGGGDDAATTTATTPASTAGDETVTDGAGPAGDTSTAAPIPTTGEPPPDLPTATCFPVGGTYWVLEGQPVTVPVTCGSGDDPGEYSLGLVPPGLQLGPTEISWTPGLDQAATWEFTLTVENGEQAALTIGVIDNWADPGNVPVLDATRYTAEYGLPVLHLQTDPGITDAEYTPATVTYRGHVFTAEAKHRGAASLGYPKKSYTLKFAKDDEFHEPAQGFLGKRRIVLISTFDDNTYIRQRLAYELWNDLDPDHLQIQTYGAVVFLDGAYWGLYAVADHVDRHYMEDQGFAEAGNLYKARTHDANFRLTDVDDDPKGTPHDGITKEEGLPVDGEPGAYDDLDELITWVATAPQAQFTGEIDARIDRRDYEDWWIFVTLIMGDDSAGKNAYHYHDPNGGPWRYAPWDFNDSFGQTWQTARKGFDAHPEDYVWANELFARMLLDPGLGPPLRARYAAALTDVYSLDRVLDRVDELALEVLDSAHRDELLWASQYQTYGGWNWRDDFVDHDLEMLYLRQWIADRWAFVAALY